MARRKKHIPGVPWDLAGHLRLAPEMGRGLFLMHMQVITQKVLLQGQDTRMGVNSASTRPSPFPFESLFRWGAVPGRHRYLHKRRFCKRHLLVQFPKLMSPFSANVPSSGATSRKETQDILYARQKIIVVAKAFGLQAIDLVYIDFRDGEGLLKQARAGAAMGFTGMLLGGTSESSV